MSLAETLWTKNASTMESVAPGIVLMRYADFLAAIKEYGEAVRKRDAELCRGLFANHYDHSQKKIGAIDCAAAIEREPLP